jgi:hypothetical protein
MPKCKQGYGKSVYIAGSGLAVLVGLMVVLGLGGGRPGRVNVRIHHRDPG